jgi:hypothetical protein
MEHEDRRSRAAGAVLGREEIGLEVDPPGGRIDVPDRLGRGGRVAGGSGAGDAREDREDRNGEEKRLSSAHGPS